MPPIIAITIVMGTPILCVPMLMYLFVRPAMSSMPMCTITGGIGGMPQ